MNNELQILNNLDKNENATQREIAKSIGISLGNVNILIKRLVKKGMLKIERINRKTIRYVLTPIGLKEKAEATYKYVVSSFKYINSLEKKIDFYIETLISFNSNQLILYGEEDEIYMFLSVKLSQIKINHKFIDNLEIMIDYYKKNDILVLVWQPIKSEELTKNNISYTNLLDIV